MARCRARPPGCRSGHRSSGLRNSSRHHPAGEGRRERVDQFMVEALTVGVGRRRLGDSAVSMIDSYAGLLHHSRFSPFALVPVRARAAGAGRCGLPYGACRCAAFLGAVAFRRGETHALLRDWAPGPRWTAGPRPGACCWRCTSCARRSTRISSADQAGVAANADLDTVSSTPSPHCGVTALADATRVLQACHGQRRRGRQHLLTGRTIVPDQPPAHASVRLHASGSLELRGRDRVSRRWHAARAWTRTTGAKISSTRDADVITNRSRKVGMASTDVAQLDAERGRDHRHEAQGR